MTDRCEKNGRDTRDEITHETRRMAETQESLRPVNVMRSPRGFRNRTIMCTTQRGRARNCPIPESIKNCITFTHLNECFSLDVDYHVTIFTKKPLNTPTPYNLFSVSNSTHYDGITTARW